MRKAVHLQNALGKKISKRVFPKGTFSGAGFYSLGRDVTTLLYRNGSFWEIWYVCDFGCPRFRSDGFLWLYLLIFSKFIFLRNWAILSRFCNISDQSGRFEPSQERRRRRYAAPPVGRRSSSKWMWDYGKLFWGESGACSSFLGSAWLGVSTVFLTVQIGWNWHKLAPAGLRSPFSRKSCGCRMLQTRESLIMYCYHTLFYWYIGIEWNIHSTSILSKFPLCLGYIQKRHLKVVFPIAGSKRQTA